MRLLYFFLAFFSSLCAFGEDASMFRGNPQHTGVYDAAGVPEFTKIKWKFHTGGQVISSPAVVDDTVYVGSTDHNLYAIDLETGMQKWKFETKSRITSSPAAAGKKVYFGSYDGAFYALEATKGQLIWKFQTAGERRFAGKHLHGAQPVAETMPDPFDFYLSSPALWNGAVYFGSGDGNIYALDMASGSSGGNSRPEMWCTPPDNFPMAHYLSGVGIVIFMRSMLHTDKKNGALKLERTMTFITRSAFSLPRESTMVQSTSVAATQISMRLMLAVVNRSGFSIIKVRG